MKEGAEPKPTLEDINRQIKELQQLKLEMAHAEIAATLRKYGLKLTALPRLEHDETA